MCLVYVQKRIHVRKFYIYKRNYYIAYLTNKYIDSRSFLKSPTVFVLKKTDESSFGLEFSIFVRDIRALIVDELNVLKLTVQLECTNRPVSSSRIVYLG